MTSEEKKEHRMTVYLSEGERDEVKAAADRDGLKPSIWARRILTKAANEGQK